MKSSFPQLILLNVSFLEDTEQYYDLKIFELSDVSFAWR